MLRWKRWMPVGVALMASVGVVCSGAAWASSGTDVPGSAAPGLSNFTDLGPAPEDAVMHIALYLKLRGDSVLRQAIANRETFTPAQFRARFSPTSDAYQAVVNQVRNAGLTVDGVADNHLVVDASGTVAQVESLLGTPVHAYRDQQGRTFFANPEDFRVSGALAANLAGATGVDQLSEPAPLLARVSGPA
ncbi:MAG: hypothetical protein K6T30_05510, partial [Alicyclobacillus sp.]|nr:hypothetical protein [Alicyclobacillus sp.]